jgi:two-component system chemotaxis sensor kinase CheA
VADGLDTSSLVKDYLEDARSHLDALDGALLELEHGMGAGFDVELVNGLLGSLHTLKGNSGMMGFTTVQKFVHQLEGVFKRLLDNPALLEQNLLDALFEGATILRNSVETVGTNPQPELSQEAAFLESLAVASGGGVRSSPRRGKKASPAAGGQPDVRKPAAERSASGAPADGGQAVRPGQGAAKTSVLRVDFERLDHLLNLTGELVIHKTKLNQIVKTIEDLVGAEEFFGELPGLAQAIEKTTGELQEAIMRVRMLPIRQVFQRFPRMVRDLAKQKGKEVELTFSGEDTEIDKTVIDALGDPLLHLIRNSIDHGIELPEVRRAAGKERSGSIHLSARQESSHIVITVRDDGAGMKADRIRKKAVEKGLIAADQPISSEEVYGLVFVPGFSTAEEVSETSGRGVGLDVVKNVISDFNGIIEVKSEAGLGTEFILKMPLTLAIIPALLVEVSGGLYAVPLSAVLESIKIPAIELHRVDGKEVVQLRGSVMPVKRLSQILDLPAEEQDHYYMVVLGRAEKRVGLIVDRLRGQQEIVIKALDEYLGDTFGVSGATILGDGSVVLIVDTAKIL